VDDFTGRVSQGHFLEHASYNGKHYGTLRSEVERFFAAGKHVVLDIDVEGARQIRQAMPDAVSVFVLPPSGTELVRRLKGRQTEGAEVLRKRLAIADAELKAVGDYEYVVVNDDLDRVVGDVNAIVEAESRRASRRDGLPAKVDAIRHEIEIEAGKLQ
jgi:guanylate kinase